ncbi:MAG TPA: adenylate/guanylate cyclase domain-containing protein, partial [Steroidobacteraceae bacterium]
MESDRHPETTLESSVARPNERGSQVRAASGNTPQAIVLRTNLRGFRRAVELLGSQAFVSMLDEYVEFVSQVTRRNGGEVFKVDTVAMTLGFGLGEAKPKARAEVAVRTAKQLLDGFEQLSNRWRECVDARIALGVGIHQGEVIAASLASGSNRGPALVGDTVNVAARLAERARAGEAILSASIREALRDQLPGLEIKPLGGLSFAGRTRHVDIYCIPRADRLDLGEGRRESTR